MSGLPSLSRFPPKLLLNRLDHEVHERDVVCHAVQLEAPVKVLRDAGRQLRPGFVGLRHQAALFFDPGDRDRPDRVPAAKPQRNQWSRGESNPRPLECDSSALPTELRPHRREESEQSRGYSPTAPAGQPVSRAQGEPAPGTSTVVARIRAPRWARASARGMAVAARTKSVRRSTPPSMHAMT